MSGGEEVDKHQLGKKTDDGFHSETCIGLWYRWNTSLLNDDSHSPDPSGGRTGAVSDDLSVGITVHTELGNRHKLPPYSIEKSEPTSFGLFSTSSSTTTVEIQPTARCLGVSGVWMQNREFNDVAPLLSHSYGLRFILGVGTTEWGKRYEGGVGVGGSGGSLNIVPSVDVVNGDDRSTPPKPTLTQDLRSLQERLSELQQMESEDLWKELKEKMSAARDAGAEAGKTVGGWLRQDIKTLKRWLKSFWK